MWILIFSFIVLIPFFWKIYTSKNQETNKKWNKFKISLVATIDFLFRMKDDERMEAFRKIHSLYPKFVHLDLFKILVVYDPEVYRKLFSSVHAMQRPFGNFVPLKNGLLFSPYNEWREPRKHLNLAFNLNVLKGFIPIFASYSQSTVQEMEKHANGGEFDLHFYIAFLTVQTVSATLLNVHRSDLASFEKVSASINIMSETLFERISNPFYHSDFIYKFTASHKRGKEAIDFLMQYGNELIDEARHKNSLLNAKENKNIAKNKPESKRPKINFIVDQLINHEEKYSDQEIRDQLLTLQITASDTTMNLVSACFMYLAINQEIQQKVHAEIVDVFDENFDFDYERITELKYLEKCLKETLRLFTPLPMTMREVVEDCDLGTGRTVRKGTKIFIMNFVLHQRKDIWGRNSKKFDPENFSPEKSSLRDPFSFAPFGFGARNCIGTRYTMIAAKVFVASLLKTYKFTTKLTEADMKMKLNFTGKLASEYLVSIEKR